MSESPAPEEVKSARLAAGLTQEQAGSIVGAARRTWQDWERGQRRMSPGLFELFNIKTKPRSTQFPAAPITSQKSARGPG